MPTYIIEHLEPELWDWCLIEYKNISKTVGKDNLWFTNIKKDADKLEKYGKVIKESVKELNLKNACVLDPESKDTLKTKDKFDYFIFGGILGDYPPKKRTEELLTKFLTFETRNIGKEQMSTDNAVLTVKMINDGTEFEKIKFADNIEIETNENESVQLPYRYVLIKGKPFISEELIKRLEEGEEF